VSAAKLHISDELALPRDAVTSTFVVYGGKGMGKTNFGSVFAEELSHARLRFAVIDPMGVWWGLRYSADGKSPGTELLILGGVKGDMPIEPTSGAVVADLVADESVNVLIDISRHANGKMWSIGERIRFVRDYFVQLYARQGEEKRPLMQIVDEAARFAPQLARHGEEYVAQCLGAVAVMVEEGRNVGVGVCLLTQRSARLNKDVAELADCMISFRIVGPRSIQAVLDWFGEHIEKSRWKDLIEKLRKLPIGKALVVSPGWLEFEGEAQIRRRETFDSSATPKPGEKAKAPRGAAAMPDLAKYQERMAATIERAKAEDPKALRAEIARLQREVVKTQQVAGAYIKTIEEEKKKPGKVDPKNAVRAADVAKAQRALEAAMKFIVQITTRNFDPSLPDEEKQAIHGAIDVALTRLESVFERRLRDFDKLKKDAADLVKRMQAIAESEVPVAVEVRHNEPFTVAAPRIATPRQSGAAATAPAEYNGEQLTNPQQRILDALASLHSLGLRDVAKSNAAVFADQSPTSSGYQNNLGRLRSLGLIHYPQQGRVALTDEGDKIGQVGYQITTRSELHRAWFSKLPNPKVRILEALIAAYPDALDKQKLAEESGQSPTSSGYQNNLGNLRSLGLIDYPQQGSVVATDLLFPEGLG
jgi:hypothetical protein